MGQKPFVGYRFFNRRSKIVQLCNKYLDRLAYHRLNPLGRQNLSTTDDGKEHG